MAAGLHIDQATPDPMPPKVRELVARLEKAGFQYRSGKGSHRNFTHPALSQPITLSGRLGQDAKPYQIHTVQRALEELTK